MKPLIVRSAKACVTKGVSTPGALQRLALPHCTFALDQWAHRFSFRFRKVPDPNVWNGRTPLTMLKAFVSTTWKEALPEVHAGAWKRWNLAKEQEHWKLSDPALVQVPRRIPNNIFESLEDVITSMPPRVKYGKS